MNCWRVQNLVAPFLDGELPDAECEAVAAHLEVCGECTDMVTSVEALPPLVAPRAPKEMEESLFEHFDACLAERLAAGLPSLEDEAPRSAGAALVALTRREVRIPASFAAAWLGVMVMLAGGVALNHTKVQDLESSVARREAIIQALQERVAIADSRQTDTAAPGREFRPVLLPAGAPSALGSTLPLPSGPYRQPGIVGATVRQVAYDAPRVVR